MLVALVLYAALGAPSGARAEDTRSVYRVRPSVDVPVTLAAGLAVVVPYALSRVLIDPHCPCDARDVNTFDRHAIGNASRPLGRLSDVTIAGTLLVPLVLDTLDLGLSRPLFEDVLVFAEALAINGALNTAVKFVVQRPLPRTYDGDPSRIDEPDGYRSFYSGHTSLAFTALSATAMTLHLRHAQHVWPWLVTLGVGSGVAVMRVRDGQHFASDVIVGALAGSAIGALVPWLHTRPRAGQPTLGVQRAGLWIGWSRTL